MLFGNNNSAHYSRNLFTPEDVTKLIDIFSKQYSTNSGGVEVNRLVEQLTTRPRSFFQTSRPAILS